MYAYPNRNSEGMVVSVGITVSLDEANQVYDILTLITEDKSVCRDLQQALKRMTEEE